MITPTFTKIIDNIDNNISLDSLTGSLKTISNSAKEKFLSIFWNVKKRVSDTLSDILLEDYTLETNKKSNYSVVNNYKDKSTPSVNDDNFTIPINNTEKLLEKITGEYIYKNTKWNYFNLKIVDNIIQEIVSNEWNKVSYQQKLAIQRLLNNKKLDRFQLINTKSEKRKENIEDKEMAFQSIKSPNHKDNNPVEASISSSEKLSTEEISSEEIARKVKIHTETIINANKRNKVIIDVYTKLKQDEIWLFSNDSKKQVIIAKKVIRNLWEIIPKSSQTVTNIQVNTTLLNRVVNSISNYLEKTGLENKQSENSRESLLRMLRQSKYILQDVIVPKKVTWHTYQAVYA